MKKLMAVALLLGLGLVTLGCGDSKPAAKKTTTPSTTSAPADAKPADAKPADAKPAAK